MDEMSQTNMQSQIDSIKNDIRILNSAFERNQTEQDLKIKQEMHNLRTQVHDLRAQISELENEMSKLRRAVQPAAPPATTYEVNKDPRANMVYSHAAERWVPCRE